MGGRRRSVQVRPVIKFAKPKSRVEPSFALRRTQGNLFLCASRVQRLEKGTLPPNAPAPFLVAMTHADKLRSWNRVSE